MPPVLLELAVIALLLILNGAFAMAEIAIVSARKVRLRQAAEAGDERARVALELAVNPNELLATVQIGITLIGIVAGAFGGATLARALEAALAELAPLRPYAGGLAFGLVVLGITFCSLVVGELVPKRLALNHAESIAISAAGPMRVLSRMANPVVALLGATTDLLLRLVRARPVADLPVTEDEIRALMHEGTRAGVFETAEAAIVASVFNLTDRQVRTLMTPRAEIAWLNLEDSADLLQKVVECAPHSHYPVGRGALDQLVGVLYVRDLVSAAESLTPEGIQRAMRAPLVVPETLRAPRLLERFRQARQQCAVVLDEYGVVQGVATSTDVLEALVGELPDSASASPEAFEREDGTWLLDGLLPLDEMRRLLALRTLPEEAGRVYFTLGGLMMHELGRVPASGDEVFLDAWRFRVVAMDGRRVDQVVAAPVEDSGSSATTSPVREVS